MSTANINRYDATKQFEKIKGVNKAVKMILCTFKAQSKWGCSNLLFMLNQRIKYRNISRHYLFSLLEFPQRNKNYANKKEGKKERKKEEKENGL